MKDKSIGTRTAYLGIFLSIALILGYIEFLIPFHFGVPGIKLGLTNLAILILLYRMGEKEAFMVSILRIILSSILFGTVVSLLYSLAGGMFSLLVMSVLKKADKFSVIGVSIAGGVAHNIGQIVIAMLVISQPAILLYSPALLIAGMVTGSLIGFIARMVINRI